MVQSELDRRCDVYTLGVIGHELLAGKPPHDIRKRTIPEAVRIIHDEEPSRLGSINSIYRGDIETIISKAHGKGPRATIPVCGRDGFRHPTIPPGPADPGETNQHLLSVPQVRAAQQGFGRRGGGGNAASAW